MTLMNIPQYVCTVHRVTARTPLVLYNSSRAHENSASISRLSFRTKCSMEVKNADSQTDNVSYCFTPCAHECALSVNAIVQTHVLSLGSTMLFCTLAGYVHAVFF